jgi:hypothetical protein
VQSFERPTPFEIPHDHHRHVNIRLSWIAAVHPTMQCHLSFSSYEKWVRPFLVVPPTQTTTNGPKADLVVLEQVETPAHAKVL